MKLLDVKALNLIKDDNPGFYMFNAGSVQLLLEPTYSYQDSGKTTLCSNNTECLKLSDISGNGFDFSSVGANNPVFYSTGGRNGNSFLRFRVDVGGNPLLSLTNRAALKCLHDGTGGSIYVVADYPSALLNSSYGVVIASNAGDDANVGFSVPMGLYGASLAYSKYEVTNGTAKILEKSILLNNFEFRVFSARIASSSTPDVYIQGDADFEYDPDTSEVIDTGNFTGAVSTANSGSDITIGEIGSDTGFQCEMDLYFIAVFDEYLTDAKHVLVMDYLKKRFALPNYTIL